MGMLGGSCGGEGCLCGTGAGVEVVGEGIEMAALSSLLGKQNGKGDVLILPLISCG